MKSKTFTHAKPHTSAWDGQPPLPSLGMTVMVTAGDCIFEQDFLFRFCFCRFGVRAEFQLGRSFKLKTFSACTNPSINNRKVWSKRGQPQGFWRQYKTTVWSKVNSNETTFRLICLTVEHIFLLQGWESKNYVNKRLKARDADFCLSFWWVNLSYDSRRRIISLFMNTRRFHLQSRIEDS